MSTKVSTDEFVQLARRFNERLGTAKSFDDVREMWRSTSIDYGFKSPDPFSDSYRAEVLKVYEGLTRATYSTQNELASTKLSAEMFAVGYPWISKNLEVVAQELAKTVQALQALHSRRMGEGKIIEFGAGWGNLAIPLAKAGKDVSAVDIDEAFLARMQEAAKKDNLTVNTFCGDFLEVAKSLDQKYAAVIFQSSFHHCLEFDRLLQVICNGVLAESGSILFLSEPIYKGYSFPWGLRYDGESLWAIISNYWLELGFDFDFFFKLLLRNGLFLTRIEPFPPFIGEGWAGDRGTNGIGFEDWRLPDELDATFSERDATHGHGRFCNDRSVLPGLRGGTFKVYQMQFHHYGKKPLRVKVVAGASTEEFVIRENESHSAKIHADCDQVMIQSETFVPNDDWHNGDMRRLGVALQKIALRAS